MAARPVLFPGRLSDVLHGRALTVAGGFLGLCALGQLLALASYIGGGGVIRAQTALLQANSAPVVVTGPARPTLEDLAALAPAAPTPAILGGTAALPTPALTAAAPTVPTPAPALSAANDPGALPPAFVQPTPALVVPGRGSAGAGAVAEMVEQAKALRNRGDTQSALARLRDAQNLVGSAESGPVIAEMALTYEQMGMAERATQQWQRLYELGDGAGAPYYLAESRLRGIGHVQSPVGGMTGDLSQDGGGGPDPTGSGRDRNGFQQGKLLRILEVKTEEDPTDPEAEKKLAMRTMIKARAGVSVDPRKVRVEAQFYDLVGGNEVVPTDAETGFRWLTPPVDWANDASEVLEATYRRLRGVDYSPPTASALLPPPPPGPVPGRAGNARRDPRRRPVLTPIPAPEPATTHVYLGYMVRLYYNRQLQDVKAEPAQLLQRFPPALTLPPEP